MFQAAYNLLAADSEFSLALTGGLYNGLDVIEISRTDTPNAFDSNLDLLPCCLMVPENQVPMRNPYKTAAREFFVLYFYNSRANGYRAIKAARDRAYALLHDQQVTPVDGSGCWQLQHVGDTLHQEDPTLEGGVPMEVSRFMGIILRGDD
jgi:hypothetical protein